MLKFKELFRWGWHAVGGLMSARAWSTGSSRRGAISPSLTKPLIKVILWKHRPDRGPPGGAGGAPVGPLGSDAVDPIMWKMGVSLLKVFIVRVGLVAAATVCPNGAIASPNSTWAACFSVTGHRASSLRQCVASCGELGMTPAHIISAEENDFAASVVPDDDWAMLGHYQGATSGDPAKGWGQCVAGDAARSLVLALSTPTPPTEGEKQILQQTLAAEARVDAAAVRVEVENSTSSGVWVIRFYVTLPSTGFANWAGGQPNDFYGLQADCVVMTGQGRWMNVPCRTPAALGVTFRCLCEGPSSPSDSFEQDLEALEAPVDAAMREKQARVAAMYPCCFVLTVLPALLFLGYSWWSRGRAVREAAANAAAAKGAAEKAEKEAAEAEGNEDANVAAEKAAAAKVAAEKAAEAAADANPGPKGAAGKLRAAQRSAAQRRLRVSGLMAQSGWALTVFGFAPLVMLAIGVPISAVVGPTFNWFVLGIPGLFLLLLAVFPTDARAIRTVCAVLFAVYAGLGVVFLASAVRSLSVIGFLFAVLFLAQAASLGPTLVCKRSARPPPPPPPPSPPGVPPPSPRKCPLPLPPLPMQPRQALMWLWRMTRLFSSAWGIFFIGLTSADLATSPSGIRDPGSVGALAYGVIMIACALVFSTANRGRIHRRLGRLGGLGSEAEEAAAISALVAGAKPKKVIEDAKKTFRCMRAKDLKQADLGGSSDLAGTSAAELRKKTTEGTMGKVTCFLSHSWKDEKEAPGKKFEKFEEWAEKYRRRENGKEPTIWLDKASCLPPLLPLLPPSLQLIGSPRAPPSPRERLASISKTSTEISHASPSSCRAARSCSSWRGQRTAAGCGASWRSVCRHRIEPPPVFARPRSRGRGSCCSQLRSSAWAAPRIGSSWR